MDGLLFIELGETLICRYIKEFKTTYFLNEKVFEEYDDNDYSGFYDWLRTKEGNIIGIRYSALDKDDGFIESMKIMAYTTVLDNNAIELFFYDNRIYGIEASNDQDFGLCKIYMSDYFDLAMIFDIEYLNREELDSIPIIKH